MSELERDIEQVEMDIEHAKKFIADGDRLNRLTQNADFKELIIRGYLENEAIRLVHIKNDPNTQTEEIQKNIEQSINGISSLVSHLREISMKANEMRRAVKSYEEEQDSMREELAKQQG